MSVSKVLRNFSKVTDNINRFNSKFKTKRFHAMTHHHHGKTVEVGVYDSKMKTYAVTDVRAYNAVELVDEMKGMLARASKG